MQHKISKEQEGDTVFLNVNLFNPPTSTQALAANLSQTFYSPIVDKPKDYNLIISRFSIPGRSIPLFTSLILTFDIVL